MVLREKWMGDRTSLYLVESVREGGKPKQRIMASLGHKEAVLEKGDLDRLVRSIGRYATRSVVLSLLDDATTLSPPPGGSGPGCCSNGYGPRSDAARC